MFFMFGFGPSSLGHAPFNPEVEARSALETDFFAEIRRSSADPNVHRSGDIDAGPPGKAGEGPFHDGRP